jgi:hypothetical protein
VKIQTLEKLHEFVNDNRIEFTEDPKGLAVKYDLSDEELSELVQIEYGQTSQSVVELFTVMCKKLVKIALEQEKV